ncbi:hypothetical protein B0O80DRAFT_455818, partial [Mortierella sp. GBAus27b]
MYAIARPLLRRSVLSQQQTLARTPISTLSGTRTPAACRHRLCFSTTITSLSGTHATTSALPRHVSPALPNRVIRSI